ncbi:hypothetical protein SDC9_152214 [bioreactor metagenome]|uniref:Uncharacterized protein n=1 Tax=bioreactor metagenome TaxID=1076179 RepID=A0A645ESH3_9ZZZZ
MPQRCDLKPVVFFGANGLQLVKDHQQRAQNTGNQRKQFYRCAADLHRISGQVPRADDGVAGRQRAFGLALQRHHGEAAENQHVG